jgi:hypothetical protein
MCFLAFLVAAPAVLPAAGQQDAAENPQIVAEVRTATTAGSSPASTAPETATPAAPQDAASEPTWSIGPIDFSGSVDVFYNWNNNHPASGFNALYPFAIDANQFGLNYAEVVLEHGADPVGFRVDLGFGRAPQVFNSLDNDDGFNQYLQQAFVSWKPESGNGFQLDFGKFVTSAGAELIETYPNWNYNQGILFNWAIPYYHFGLRTSFPVGEHFVGGLQVVNGWNNVVDNNSGKTIGVTSAVNYDKASWFVNYYAGPENSGTNTGWRNLIDTTLLLKPTGMISAYINYDYGQNRNADGSTALDLARWQGVAGAVQVKATSKVAFTPRLEWFDDPQGFSTGTAQTLKSFTFTGEYKLVEGLMWRGEYRRDWSDVEFFERGGMPSSYKNQDTVTFALIGYFGPMR